MRASATQEQLPSFKHLIALLSDKKRKDYTFTTLFFVIFSIFIFFAIKPSLSTALNLSKQETELLTIDSKYEQLIGQIVQIQTALEEVRDRLYLIDEAMPAQPYLNVIMSDIKKAASKNNVVVRTMNVEKINLVESKQDTFRSLVVSVELGSSFDDYIKFERDLIQQRRLKNITSVTIDRDAESTESATLQISAVIEGYYL